MYCPEHPSTQKQQRRQLKQKIMYAFLTWMIRDSTLCQSWLAVLYSGVQFLGVCIIVVGGLPFSSVEVIEDSAMVRSTLKELH